MIHLSSISGYVPSVTPHARHCSMMPLWSGTPSAGDFDAYLAWSVPWRLQLVYLPVFPNLDLEGCLSFALWFYHAVSIDLTLSCCCFYRCRILYDGSNETFYSSSVVAFEDCPVYRALYSFVKIPIHVQLMDWDQPECHHLLMLRPVRVPPIYLQRCLLIAVWSWGPYSQHIYSIGEPKGPESAYWTNSSEIKTRARLMISLCISRRITRVRASTKSTES